MHNYQCSIEAIQSVPIKDETGESPFLFNAFGGGKKFLHTSV